MLLDYELVVEGVFSTPGFPFLSQLDLLFGIFTP